MTAAGNDDVVSAPNTRRQVELIFRANRRVRVASNDESRRVECTQTMGHVKSGKRAQGGAVRVRIRLDDLSVQLLAKRFLIGMRKDPFGHRARLSWNAQCVNKDKSERVIRILAETVDAEMRERVDQYQLGYQVRTIQRKLQRKCATHRNANDGYGRNL